MHICSRMFDYDDDDNAECAGEVAGALPPSLGCDEFQNRVVLIGRTVHAYMNINIYEHVCRRALRAINPHNCDEDDDNDDVLAIYSK